MFKKKSVAALIVAALMGAAVSNAAFACDARHAEVRPTKPVILFGALDDAQKEQLLGYLSGVRDKAKELNERHTKGEDISTVDREFEQYLATAEATVPFRTKVYTYTGMLCGGKVEILVPPEPGSYSVSGVDVYVKGKEGYSGKPQVGKLMYIFRRDGSFDADNSAVK